MQVLLSQYNFLKHSFTSIFLTWTNVTAYRRGISKALPFSPAKKKYSFVSAFRKEKTGGGGGEFSLTKQTCERATHPKIFKLILLNSKVVLFFRVRKFKPHHIEIENICASLMAKQAEGENLKLNRARREYVFHKK